MNLKTTENNTGLCQTRLIETNLSVQVVSKAVQELTLNGVLLGEKCQVVAEFVMGGDDGAFTVLVKLGTTCPPENLHDIQDA